MTPYQLILLKTWAISYLLNSLWQLPVIFAAAWLAARLARPTGPRTEHRIWVAALFAEILLPAFQFDLADIGSLVRQTVALLSSHTGGTAGQTRVIVTPTRILESGLHIPSAAFVAIAIAYLGSLLFFVARLARALRKTHHLQTCAHSLSPSDELRLKLDRSSRHFHLSAIRLATSDHLSSPVTFGIRQHILLLPIDFLLKVHGTDLDAVLAHECAHMSRRDYAKNILYELLALPIAWHPILWITQARLAETREIVCDELAADTLQGREHYAHALLRLAALISSEAPTPTFHAIGIFDANIFERRIMHLAHKPTQLKSAQRFAIIAATSILALATGISALALHTAVVPEGQTENPKFVQVKPDSMKVVYKVQPEYPQEAKEAKIQGSVIIGAVISKEGIAEKLKVVSGPKELQRSAIDAVSHWKWEPYLLNGEPIEVETSVTVLYSLGK
jgi:TonB family protein